MYQKTNWQSGDTITAAKLNNIENGIAGGGVLVVTDTDGILDKTWQEIADSTWAVLKVEMMDEGFYGYSPFIQYGNDEDGYMVEFFDAPDGRTVTYVAETATDYPSLA